MSKLTDKIDRAERRYAEMAGQAALEYLKAGNKESHEYKKAIVGRNLFNREYERLHELKRLAELAADGSEIEITARGIMAEESDNPASIFVDFLVTHGLIEDHINEIKERRESENAEG